MEVKDQPERIEIEFPTLPKSMSSLTIDDIIKANPLSQKPVIPTLNKYNEKKKKRLRISKNKRKIKNNNKRKNQKNNQKKTNRRRSTSTIPKKTKKGKVGMSFTTNEERKRNIENRIKKSKKRAKKLNILHKMQRKMIKEELHVSRERINYQKNVYRKKKSKEWKHRLKKSPFSIDLVAESQRIEEESRIKRYIEKRRKINEKKKLMNLKRNLIINTLLEVPNVNEIKRYHKRTIHLNEKKQLALHKLEKAERIYKQKKKEKKMFDNERTTKHEIKSLKKSFE